MRREEASTQSCEILSEGLCVCELRDAFGSETTPCSGTTKKVGRKQHPHAFVVYCHWELADCREGRASQDV